MVLMPVDMEELKKSYKVALEAGKDEFQFNGTPMATGYVKYLLEYIKNQRRKDET